MPVAKPNGSVMVLRPPAVVSHPGLVVDGVGVEHVAAHAWIASIGAEFGAFCGWELRGMAVYEI